MRQDPWPRWRRRVLVAVGVGLAALAALGLCDRWVGWRTDRLVQDEVTALQPAPVALVLGTARQGRYGINQFYLARIRAAAELYRSGAVRGIIVSGDNSRVDYDEPSDMRADLVKAGVPADFITCDYAGFRTLDSVQRCQAVFGQTDVIVVSQRFHCQRAVFIAQARGLRAQGYAADDPTGYRSWKVRLREVAARAVCVLDLYVLHRGPRFLGPPETVTLAEQHTP